MGIQFLETSAKNATNVEQAFLTMAAEIKKQQGIIPLQFSLLLNFSFSYHRRRYGIHGNGTYSQSRPKSASEEEEKVRHPLSYSHSFVLICFFLCKIDEVTYTCYSMHLDTNKTVLRLSFLLRFDFCSHSFEGQRRPCRKAKNIIQRRFLGEFTPLT